MLLGREKELAALDEEYAKNKFSLAVIYGRHRVGKTALIDAFCEGKKHIYFSALKSTSNDNLSAFSRAIHDYTGEGSSAEKSHPYRDINHILQEITAISERERIVLVIDDYPNLAKAYEDISSRLHHIIDFTWRKGNIFLVLCGTSMNFMKNRVLSANSVFGEDITFSLKLEPLDYKYITSCKPAWSAEKAAYVYGISGGIPYYVEKFMNYDSVDDAIRDQFFSPMGALFDEAEKILRIELRETPVYNSILTAIASGEKYANKISERIGVSSNICSKYLKALLELEIIEKEKSIKEVESHKTVYTIRDDFFRFWYSYIPQNMSAIKRGKSNRIFAKIIDDFKQNYMRKIFIKICTEYIEKYASDLPIKVSEAGSWSDIEKATGSQLQVDLVGAPTEGNNYIMGKCIWGKSADITDYENLKKNSAGFIFGDEYYFYLFSNIGFTDKLIDAAKKDRTKLVTLEEIYLHMSSFNLPLQFEA